MNQNRFYILEYTMWNETESYTNIILRLNSTFDFIKIWHCNFSTFRRKRKKHKKFSANNIRSFPNILKECNEVLSYTRRCIITRKVRVFTTPFLSENYFYETFFMNNSWEFFLSEEKRGRRERVINHNDCLKINL